MSWIKFKTTNLLKSILKTNFPENNDATTSLRYLDNRMR